MEDGRALIYSLAGFAGGIFLFFKGFQWLKLKRLIENMPTSKIRSIAMGLVEVFGEVKPVPKKLLVSPLLNRECVYYTFHIKERRGSGKHSYWVTLRSATDIVNFMLKDDTGEVLTDPTGAKIDIPADFNFSSRMGKDPPAFVKEYLKKNNLSFETFLGVNKEMVYEERLIEPDDKLYILGTAGDNPFVDEAKAQRGVEDIMIQKGENEKIYYISDKGEKAILSSLRWKALGGIIGGAALSVFSLAMILFYFGALF